MYTPLYIKTDNSLLSSLINIDELIKYALKNNISSLSITDNNMYGVIEFYNKCIINNIKPIIGLELTIENKKIKELKKLNTKKYRDLNNVFIVEGEHLVLEAYKNGVLKELILEENTKLNLNVETNYATYNVLKYISNFKYNRDDDGLDLLRFLCLLCMYAMLHSRKIPEVLPSIQACC